MDSASPPPSAGLADLPYPLFAALLERLLLEAPSAGIQAAAALACTCRQLQDAVAAAEPLWQCECRRLGFSLAWAATPEWAAPSAWAFLSRRMHLRVRLRRQLRQLQAFLDPVSAAAIRPPQPLAALLETEAALQAPLPPSLFELYRWCDGQDADRPGVQGLDAARLLSLDEMRQAVQDRHGPRETARAFAALTVPRSGGGGAGPGRPGPSGSGGISGSGGSDPSAGGASTSSAGGLAPEVLLLPFSGELRGRRRYCLDLQGTVWLASGWNTHRAADSLSALLRRVLT